MFALDPAFEATSEPVCRLPLCEARLQRDARWPWLVLIPRREGLAELDDLSPYDRARLIEEAVLAGAAARAVGAALGVRVDKLNTGALGNVTRQLHVHVVGRREGDPAWPGPVWGFGAAEPYAPQALARALEAARRALGS
ncbi:MAG TPA: HIT domain-containing protein [Caulobacteraceae bacterium]|nr:HIT domain-containing protein [Caulobacteraceae bacterium]